jgi:hypothetical protein
METEQIIGVPESMPYLWDMDFSIYPSGVRSVSKQNSHAGGLFIQ